MNMIYLVGIYHEYQTDTERLDSAKRELFKEELAAFCKEHFIETICEEFNEAALLHNSIKHTSVQAVADSLKIDCIFIDPDEEERSLLGIPTQKKLVETLRIGSFIKPGSDDETRFEQAKQEGHRLREKEWLRRLVELLDKPTLVVCGIDHIEPFSLLLKTGGYKVRHLKNYTLV